MRESQFKDGINVYAMGNAPDVLQAAKTCEQLARSYLYQLRAARKLGDDELLHMSMNSLPDRDGTTIPLKVVSADHTKVEVVVGVDESSRSYSLAQAVPDEEDAAAVARYALDMTILKNALFDANRRMERGELLNDN